MSCVKHLIRGSIWGAVDEHPQHLPILSVYTASDGLTQRIYSYAPGNDGRVIVNEWSFPEGKLEHDDATRISTLIGDLLYVDILYRCSECEEMGLDLPAD